MTIIDLLRAGIKAWNENQKHVHLLQTKVCACGHHRGHHCMCGQCTNACANCSCSKWREVSA